MRTALLGVVVFVALAVAGPAAAGCWATVGVSPPPSGLQAGEAWSAELTILQHGRTPLPPAVDARPTVTIVHADSGQTKTFPARPVDRSAGTYAARVVFPSGGSWAYRVYDGFDNWNGDPQPCANTHTFAAVEVDASDGAASAGPGSPGNSGGFPAWPVGGGLAGALLAAFAVGAAVRRRGPRTAAS